MPRLAISFSVGAPIRRTLSFRSPFVGDEYGARMIASLKGRRSVLEPSGVLTYQQESPAENSCRVQRHNKLSAVLHRRTPYNPTPASHASSR
jgi:hypothetical protein